MNRLSKINSSVKRIGGIPKNKIFKPSRTFASSTVQPVKPFPPAHSFSQKININYNNNNFSLLKRQAFNSQPQNKIVGFKALPKGTPQTRSIHFFSKSTNHFFKPVLQNNNNNLFDINGKVSKIQLSDKIQTSFQNNNLVKKTTLLKSADNSIVLNQKRSVGWTEWESDLKDWQGPDIPIPSDHRDFDTISRRWEIRELLELRRHCNTTAAGRIYSYSCLVFVGNRKGSAGLGYGKGPDPAKATENAFRNACRNILSLKTNQINRAIYAKFVSSRVLLRPKTWGNMGGFMMDLLMQAFGLQNVHVKTFGNRNRKNMYKAIFFALSRCVYLPADQAKHMGKKFVDMRKIWLGRPEYNREKKIYEYLSKREDYQ